MRWLVEVNYKPGFVDALGNTVKKDIEDLGISGVRNVKTAQIYSIEGELKKTQIKFICEELLTDKITQKYGIRSRGSKTGTQGKNTDHKTTPSPTYVIEVWYKKGVTDAVADTAKKGVLDLGIKGIKAVKTGQEYTIIGNISRKQTEGICRGLLANKVVQNYIIRSM